MDVSPHNHSKNLIPGLLKDSGRFDTYEAELRNSSQEKIIVPKSEVPILPSRFEEHYPANGLQDIGAQASYRDDSRRNSVHVIEYEDHWRIHIDQHNPRYSDQQIPHLVKEATGAAVTLVIAAALLYRHLNEN